MKINEAYTEQLVAQARSPDELLGTVVEICKHNVVKVKLKDSTTIQPFGVRALVPYKGG